MSLIVDLFSALAIKRPARAATLAELTDRLEAGGRAIANRCLAAPNTIGNRAALRHIVGIERWGQRRLRTLLGEPAVEDESDAYLPDAALGWAELQGRFAATRRETAALARQLVAADPGDDRTARHNDQGPLTAREWVRYLTLHARLESLRIR